MRAYKRLGKQGFTLVELMIVVAIIGVLAALAIYGVSRYFANAKTAEAKNTIGAISRAASAAFEREIATAEILAPGAGGSQSSHALCKSTGYPIPATVPVGNKINPDPANYSQDAQDEGWTCMRFSLDQPIIYQYNYRQGSGYVVAAAPDPGANGFEASATGDLDADGTYAYFARGGSIDTTTGTLTVATQVYIEAEYE